MSEIGFQNCLSETLDSNLWRFQRVNATCRGSGSRIAYRKLQNPTFDEFKRFHSTSQRLTSKIVYQKLWILATDNFKEIQYQEQQLLLANLRIPTIGLCEQCSVRWEILFWSLWHCTLSANRVSAAPASIIADTKKESISVQMYRSPCVDRSSDPSISRRSENVSRSAWFTAETFRCRWELTWMLRVRFLVERGVRSGFAQTSRFQNQIDRGWFLHSQFWELTSDLYASLNRWSRQRMGSGVSHSQFRRSTSNLHSPKFPCIVEMVSVPFHFSKFQKICLKNKQST